MPAEDQLHHPQHVRQGSDRDVHKRRHGMGGGGDQAHLRGVGDPRFTGFAKRGHDLTGV